MLQKSPLETICHWVLKYMPYYLYGLNCNCLQIDVFVEANVPEPKQALNLNVIIFTKSSALFQA